MQCELIQEPIVVTTIFDPFATMVKGDDGLLTHFVHASDIKCPLHTRSGLLRLDVFLC